MKQIQQQLFTKDDPFHVHKTLGMVALCSYLYRIPQFGEKDMGFLSTTNESSGDYYIITFLTLLVHACLNISSFEFHIPAKRIQSDGGRIWPQYRFHSLVFSCRGLMCIALNVFYYNVSSSQSPDASKLLLPHGNYCVVIGTMLLGDMASTYWVKYPSNSIRDLKASPAIKYYFSVMQFLATGVSLVGIRRCSLHYYMVMVVQVTAFLMTLRRKNLVSHEKNVAIYALLLAGGFTVGIYETYFWDTSQELLWTSAFIGTAAAVLRILCGMNKYRIWTLMHIINCYCFIPSIHGQHADLQSVLLLSPIQIRWLSVSVSLIMVLGGVWKSYCSSQQN